MMRRFGSLERAAWEMVIVVDQRIAPVSLGAGRFESGAEVQLRLDLENEAYRAVASALHKAGPIGDD